MDRPLLLLIENTNFQDNQGYQGYGQNIYAVGGTGEFNLLGCNFKSYQNSVYVSSQIIIIEECQFEGIDETVKGIGISNGGGLLIEWALNIEIISTTFKNLKAKNGGAIYYTHVSDNIVEALD